MQFASYLRIMARTVGSFGTVFSIAGLVRLMANRKAGLLAISREDLSPAELKKLAEQKSFIVSGVTLIVLCVLGLVAPWVINLSEYQIFEGYYWVGIYAALAQGLVISLAVYGCIAAFNECRVEKGKI